MIEITLDGGNLNECESDCDNNDECNGNLICHHRHDHYTGLHPPGCKGNGAIENNLFDWCVQPNPMKLGLCEGECWTDDDCESGLVCSTDTTGSCSGTATSGWKYCTGTLASSCSTLEQAEAVVVISTCYYPEENYWKIVDANTNAIVQSGVLPYQDRTHIFDQICLPDGEYLFTIEDWGGDGLTSAKAISDGTYRVIVDGTQVAQGGGNFGSSESTTFSVPVPKVDYGPCHEVTCSNRGKCEVTSHTTAECKCENTFVNSESGLDCICPTGTFFNVNANRCFEVTSSPTTASPTKFPTFPPTLTPSTSFPTSISHAACIAACDNVLLDSVCEDDTSYTFNLIYVQDPQKKTKTCGWLTANRNKAEKRIARYCNEDFDNGALIRACVKSCGLCEI